MSDTCPPIDGGGVVSFPQLLQLVRLPSLRFWIDGGVVSIIANTEENPCSCCFPRLIS